jgi:DNA-binding MltR family transcriptional regulator
MLIPPAIFDPRGMPYPDSRVTPGRLARLKPRDNSRRMAVIVHLAFMKDKTVVEPTNLPRVSLQKLVQTVGALSQSATVLVACAVLDTELERALKANMRPASKAIYSRIFNGYGPLSTFSSKVDLAYLLDITTDSVHHNLMIVKDIRNKFAHTSVVLTLDSDIVHKYFKELNRASTSKKSNTDIFIECADEVVSFLEAYLKRKGIPGDLSQMSHATLSKL